MSMQALRTFIDERHIPVSAIASQMGLSRGGLYKKINGETDLTITEVRNIIRITRMEPAEVNHIFLTTS